MEGWKKYKAITYLSTLGPNPIDPLKEGVRAG